MPTTWQLDCLYGRFNSLEAEILRLKSKYHPYSEPNTIYSALLAVLSDRRRALQDSFRLFAKKNPPYFHGLYEEAARDVHHIFTGLSFADRVDSSRIPFELLRALNWAAGDLLQEQCRTVVRLFTDYNYAIISCRHWFAEYGWEMLWNRTTRPKEDSPLGTVLVLVFPSAEVGSILLHAIAAHELGHVVLARFNKQILEIQSTVVARAIEAHQQFLQDFILDNVRKREGTSNADAYEESSNRLHAALLRLSSYWLTEIWADLLAARLVGPAGLAAFDRVALEPSEPSTTHPPGSFRRRVIKEYLERELPLVAADPVWTSVLTPWQSSTTIRLSNVLEAPLFPIIEWMCTESLPLLAPLLKEISSPLAGDVTSVLRAMEEYIEHLCPPNQALPPELADKPGAVWILMYAVWHFRSNARKFDAFCASMDANSTTAEGILGNLLLHALSSADLMAHWREKSVVAVVS